jgi:hypothetical protein
MELDSSMLRVKVVLFVVLDGLKGIWLASDISLLVGGGGGFGATTVVVGLLVVAGGPLAFSL